MNSPERIDPSAIREALRTALNYQTEGNLHQAEALYRLILQQAPSSVETWCHLGRLLSMQGRLDEAIATHERALALEPRAAEIHNNIGNFLYQQGRYGEAIERYHRALVIKPEFAGAYFNRANALQAQGRLQEAEASYRQALAKKPDYADALYNLIGILSRQGKFDEVANYYQKKLENDPGQIDALHTLAALSLYRGRLDDAIRLCGEIIRLKPDARSAYERLLFALLCQSEERSHEILEISRRYAQQFESALTRSWPAHSNDRDPDRRLRIGYVSADFREHSVAYFLEPLLAHHNHAEFEVFVYHTHPVKDAITDRFLAYTDHWRDCAGYSDDRVAATISADGIDILVDLAGHTGDNRLMTFARKPAPIQATYLGYPASTGLSSIDYRITTLDTDPAGSELLHTEKLFRLPHTLWCYRPAGGVRAACPAPAGRKGFITFGSANSFWKLSPQTIETWGEILRTLPGSVLFLTNVPEGSARASLIQRLAAYGVNAGRVAMHWRLPKDEFHNLADTIDIMLDPFPYNGTTTTCDALWMGIPVVTRIGKTSVARSGYALLKSMNLTELCANDESEYAQIAIGLARDLQRLDSLRMGMRERMAASPLRDEKGFALDIERGYRTMWRVR